MAKTQAAYDDGDGSSGIVAYSDADGGIVPAGVAAVVDETGVAVPVSAANPMPVILPAGAATEATTAAIAEGIGAPDDAAAGTDTGTWSLLALVKRGLQALSTLLGRVPALVGGRVPVDGSGVTQPVSGPLTDAQLRASAVPTADSTPDAVSGTLSATGQTLVLTPPDGTTDVLIQFTVPDAGSYNGANVVVEVDAGGGTWVADRSGACLYGSGANPTANSLYTDFSAWLIQLLPGPGYANVVHRTGSRTVRCRITNDPPAPLSVRMIPVRTSGVVQPVTIGQTVPVVSNRAFFSSGPGLNAYRRISTADTNIAQISFAGRVYSIQASNKHATDWAFLKLYESGSAPNLATDTPRLTIALPPLSSDEYLSSSVGIYGIGWWHAITGGVGDTDTAAIGADDVVVNITY